MILRSGGQMGANANEAMISRLEGYIHQKLAHLIEGSGVALLDYPQHSNVGDAAIWLGEINYLKKYHKLSPSYVSCRLSYDKSLLQSAHPEGPILLHGGGNFGDLWPQHHAFRERVIEDWHDRPIVQMPQSIHFGTTSAVQKTAAIIAAHPNFTLLVRDELSLEFAVRHFDCEALLCPDMAFCLGPISVAAPNTGLVALLRSDLEGVTDRQHSCLGDLPIEDWLDENIHAVRLAKLVGGSLALVRNGFDQFRSGSFQSAAKQRVERGLDQLSRGKVILTDRLHAHILAVLIGRPHVIMDNSYGKIGNFYRAFTREASQVRYTTSLEEAISLARSI
jgi:pyruvyl transferase EpsO